MKFVNDDDDDKTITGTTTNAETTTRHTTAAGVRLRVTGYLATRVFRRTASRTHTRARQPPPPPPPPPRSIPLSAINTRERALTRIRARNSRHASVEQMEGMRTDVGVCPRGRGARDEKKKTNDDDDMIANNRYVYNNKNNNMIM